MMRKIFFTLFVVFTVFNLNAQNPKFVEFWKLYKKKKYDLIIEKGDKILKSDPENVEYNLIVGKAYYRKDKFEESMPYFLLASQHNDLHSTIKARAELYLGVCYYLKGDLEKSRQSFLEGRKIKTYSSYNEANEYWYERLGFDEFYNDWNTFETDHFRFYFQDTTDINHKRFINDCEKAFTEINKFFNSDLPKKIDYYVWASNVDAQNLLKKHISFTDAHLCYIHGGNDEAEGHEIAHDISLNYSKIENKQKFISEGTASYFDQTNLNREAYFRELLKRRKKKKVSVKDVWLNWYDYNSGFSYNLAGLFVGEMIEKYGKEKFLEFFTNQSYKNAKEVFGEDFNDFIKDFESKFNLN